MSSNNQPLTEILSKCRAKAIKNLLSSKPAPFSHKDLCRIEAEIAARARQTDNLVELFEEVRKIAIDAETPESVLRQMRVAIDYPVPRNPFTQQNLAETEPDFQRTESICREAAEWLKELHDQPLCSENPALRLYAFIIAAIIEFRVLHVDYIPAIMKSLHEKRQFRIQSDAVWAIPLSLRYGRQTNAEGRLLVLRHQSVHYLHEFLKVKDTDPVRASVLRIAAKGETSSEKIVGALEKEVARNLLVGTGSLKARFPSLEVLIRAAQVRAMLDFPSVVVAHRSRQIVSHSLPPEVLGRILNRRLPSFPPADEGLKWDASVQDDPGVRMAEDPREDPEWLKTIRNALSNAGLDHQVLGNLANGTDETAKMVAKFALYLEARDCCPKGVYGAGACKPPTVRRYSLLIATKVLPRLRGCLPTEVTDEQWEEVIDQVLDEDAFYQLRQYSANPRSTAQTYSRPLVKALRHWLRFLKSERNSEQNEQILAIERKLPVLGLVMVDASIITEDEYREALDRLGGEWGRRKQDEREATQVALILGYRCGLRRAEASGLRVRDFDEIDFLHVRPTNDRQLKTSNARRDLPLAVLVPPDELEKVRNRIKRIKGCVPDSFSSDACIFPDTEDRLKPMKNFNSIVQDIHSAFRGDKEIEWTPIDEGFHYHRLRHSLANFILLKLWPGLDKLNFLFKVWDARKEVGATDHSRMLFRNRLFCSEKISAFDLQAIALLLGHGSAATSLEHYIHVLDWYEKPD